MAARVEMWRYRGLVGNLARRELKLRYKHSILGWLWSLLTPAATLVIYTIVFGIFLRIETPTAGNGTLKSFPLFLFMGLLVWNFFSATVTGSMNWLLGAGPLLKKVYFPPESPVFAGALSALVQAATEAGIVVIVLAFANNLSATAFLLAPVIFLLLLFALGIGLVASLMNVYFRDVSHIVSIGMTLLFYSTPIVYPFSLIPEEIWGGVPIRQIVRFNPLTQFVGTVRDVLYDMRVPNLWRLAALTVLSVVTFLIGWAAFRRYGARLSEDL